MNEEEIISKICSLKDKYQKTTCSETNRFLELDAILHQNVFDRRLEIHSKIEIAVEEIVREITWRSVTDSVFSWVNDVES